MDLALAPLIFLAFFLVGEKVCGMLGLCFAGRGERVLFSTSAGHVCFSLASMALVFTHLAYPASFALLLGGALLFRPRRLMELGRATAAWPRTLAAIPWRDPGALPLALLGLLAVLAALKAATPPVGTDALVYHLAVPKAYLENHGLAALPNNIYSFYPQQMEMLFLPALALGGGELAQAVGLGLALLLLLGLYLFAKPWCGPRLAALAPLIFFSTPTFFKISSAAYIDLQLAGFVFLSFFAWTLWRKRKEDGWFVLMSVFAGAAFATKLTGVIALPLAFLGLLIKARERNSTPWLARKILLFTALSLALILPWWARNYYFTGNPFAPFFMQFFGGEQAINWDAGRNSLWVHYLKMFGMGQGALDFLLLPWNLTFHAAEHSLRFDGRIGIACLLLLPGLFFLRRSALPLAAMFAVLFVFWFQQTQQIRMLAPAFAFLALLLAAGFARMIEALPRPGHLAAVGLAGLGLAFNTGLIVKDWLHAAPLAYLAGRETREEFITRHIPAYPVYRAMNESLDPAAVAMFVYMRNLGYLSERKFFSDTFQESHTLQTLVARDPSPEGLLRQMRALGVTDLMMSDDFVFGENSAFPAEGRAALKTLLDGHARLVLAKNGYSLFHFVVD